MTEAEARVFTLCATVQEIPPDHRGGCTLGRDELTVEDSDYDQALAAAAARRRVRYGWRIIALRVERNSQRIRCRPCPSAGALRVLRHDGGEPLGRRPLPSWRKPSHS